MVVPDKLHLGCGDRRLDGWLNVDGQATAAADRVVNVYDMWSLPRDHFTWAYASHLIEHLYPDKLPDFLRSVRSLLVPGGRLTIATTDFEGIYRHRFLDQADGDEWEAALFGEPCSFHHPMAAHRNCFTYGKLCDLLIEAGFARARPWRPEQYPEILALGDFATTARRVSCYAEGVK